MKSAKRTTVDVSRVKDEVAKKGGRNALVGDAWGHRSISKYGTAGEELVKFGWSGWDEVLWSKFVGGTEGGRRGGGQRKEPLGNKRLKKYLDVSAKVLCTGRRRG